MVAYLFREAQDHEVELDPKDPQEVMGLGEEVERKVPSVHVVKTEKREFPDLQDHPDRLDHPDHRAWRMVAPELSQTPLPPERWRKGPHMATMATITDITRARRLGPRNT